MQPMPGDKLRDATEAECRGHREGLTLRHDKPRRDARHGAAPQKQSPTRRSVQ